MTTPSNNTTKRHNPDHMAARLLDTMKMEIVNLHQALENERSAVRGYKRQLNLAVRAAREEEAKRRAECLCDLKLRLEKNHEDSLRKQSDALSKAHSIEILAALRKKDAEHRELLSAALHREEDLKVLLRDAERLNLTNRSTPCSQCENFDRLQTERAQLKDHTAELEERLKVLADSNRQKVEDLRRQSEMHDVELSKLKRTTTIETQRLLDELRAKERALTQLERENEEQAGRLQLQNEVLEQHRPGHKCSCPMEKCPWAREKHLVAKLAHLQVEMKRVGESHAQEKRDLLNGGKTMPRRNRSALELETLRQQLQDREQEIAQLRQATKDKDHKLEQLTSRYRREQMRHYYRQQFMELEPVLEEDSEAEEGSPDSSPSNSPSPGLRNMWNKSPTPNYHEELYLELLKEHTELQHAFQRSQLDHRLMERLDHELVLASAQNKELKKALKQAVAVGKASKVNSKMSAQVQECQAREAALQTENLELREQNELLEFRILELENLSARGSVLDTCDACTDTDGIMDSNESSMYPNRDLMSDADLGVYDLVMDYEHEDLKSRLLQVAKTLQNAPDKSCLLQILALLDSYEQRLDIECLGSLNKSISLGRPRRNLTEHLSRSGGRIIATVFPFKGDLDLELDLPLQEEEVTTKQWSTECLQESGIFEELEYSNQGTQTEDILQPAETPPGNLGEELQKLTRIRERIQERDSSSKLLLIPTDAVGDYNKLRLEALEEKYHEYKSLSTRLQQAEDKVSRLEEEKIRLERSEDSFRLRCQKLEEELVLLADKEKELESLLEEERLSYQEGFCRILKEKLDKEECADLLQCVIPVLIMYNVWCASKNALHDQCRCTKYYKLLGDSNTVANNPELTPKPLYYGFIPYLTSSPDFVSEHSSCKDKLPTQVVYVSDRVSLPEEPSTGNENIELELNSILNQLKDNITRETDELHDARKEEIKYKEDIKKLQEELATLKGQKSPRRDSGQERFDIDRKRLENNVDMMASKIKTLENKEKRYLETLRRGEVLINKVKQLYIHKLEDAKRSCLAFEDGLQAYERPMNRKNQGKKEECENDQLRERIIDLEERDKELSKRLQKLENEKRKLKTDINDLQADLDMSREAREDLKKNIDGTIKLAVLKEKKITQKLQDQVEELRQELANLDKKQKQKINELKKQLNEAHKEIVNCDCTISELREEVETLETTISNLTHSLEHQLQLEQVLRANLEQLTAEREHELEQARLRVMTTPNVQQELRESQISAAMKSFELEKQKFKQSSYKREPMEMEEDLSLISPESSEPHFYELGVAPQDPKSFQVYSDYRKREIDPKLYEVRAPEMESFFEEAAHVEAPEPELKELSERLESNEKSFDLEIKPDEMEGGVTVDLKPSADINESIFKETLQMCLQAHKKSLESGGHKNNIDPWFESLESLDLDALWEENIPNVSHEFSDIAFGKDHDVKRQTICPFQEIGGDRLGSYKRDSHNHPDISYQSGIKVRRLSIDEHGQLFYIDTEGDKVFVDSEGKAIKTERSMMAAGIKSQTLDPLWANKPAPEEEKEVVLDKQSKTLDPLWTYESAAGEEKEVASEKLAQTLDPSWNYKPAARERMEKQSKTLDPLGNYKLKTMGQERKQVAMEEEELQALQTSSSETLPILLHQAPKPPEDNYLMHRGQEFVMGQISSKFLPEACKDAVEITHAVRKDSSGISNITRRLSTAILHVKNCESCFRIIGPSLKEIVGKLKQLTTLVATKGCPENTIPAFPAIPTSVEEEIVSLLLDSEESDADTRLKEPLEQMLSASPLNYKDSTPKSIDGGVTALKSRDGGIPTTSPHKIQDTTGFSKPTSAPLKLSGVALPTTMKSQERGVSPLVGLKSQEDRVTFQGIGVTSLPTFKPPDVSVSSLQPPRIPDITGEPLSSPNFQDYKKTIGAPRPCYCPPLVPTSKIETLPMSTTFQQMRTPAPVISSVSGPQGISGDKELQAPASSLKTAPLDEDETFLQDERLDCFQINVGPHHPITIDDEDQAIPQDERLDCFNIDVGPHFYTTEEEFKGMSAMSSKCKSPAPRGSSQFPYKTTSTLSKTKAYHDFSESSVRAKDTAGDLNKFCALEFDTEERPGSSLKPHVSLLEEIAPGVRLADEEFCIKSIIYETTHDTPAGPIPESVPVSEDLDFNVRVSAEDVDFGSNSKSVLEPYVKPCDFTDSQIEQSFYSALSHQTLGSEECVFPDFTIPRPILLPTLTSEVKDTLRDWDFIYRLNSTEHYPIKGDSIAPADIRLIEQVKSAPSPPQGTLRPKYTDSVQRTIPFNYLEHYITSPSKVSGESKRSMTSDLGCKVICWDETLEKKSRFTLQELSQCDILCWGLDHDYDNFGPKLIPSRGQPESFYKSDQPESFYKSDQLESFYKSDQLESLHKVGQPGSIPETNKMPRKISVVIDVAELPPSPAGEALDTVEVLRIDSTHEELYRRLSAENVNFGDDGDCILETYKDNFIFTDEQLEEAFYTSLPEEKLGSQERMFTDCFPQYKQLSEPTVPRTPPPTPVPLISEVDNVLSAKEHPLLKLQNSINSSMDCHILCWDEAFIDELMTAPIPDHFPLEDVQSDFECKVLCWAEEPLESKSSLLSLAKSSLESLRSISSEIGCRVVCWAERLGVVKKSKEPVGIAPLPSASTCEFLCWDYEEESRGAPDPLRQLQSYYSWEEVEYASITPREEAEESDSELSDIDSYSDEDEYEDEADDSREVEESSHSSKGVFKDDVIQITKTDSKDIFESIDITKDILSFVLNKLHMIKISVDGDGRDETESSIDSLVEVSSSEEANKIAQAIDYKIKDLDFYSATKHKILNLVDDISKKYGGTLINDFTKLKEDIDKVKDDDDVTKQDIDKVDRHTIFEEKSVSLVEGEGNYLKETELKQEEYYEQVEKVREELEEDLENLEEDIKEIENFEEAKTIENGESNIVSDELLEKTSEDLSEIKTNVEREILEMKKDDDKEKKEKLKGMEHLDENKLIEKDSGKQLNIETRTELLVVEKYSEEKVKIDSKLIVETLDKESEEEEVIELDSSEADTSETTKPTMVDNIPSDESPYGDPKEISVAYTKSEGPEDFTRHILLELFKGIGIVQEEVKVVKDSDKLTTAEPVEQFKTESSSSILKPDVTKNNQEVSNDTPIETDCVYITKSILLEIIEKSSAHKKNEIVKEKDIGGQTEDISQDIAQKLLHLVLGQLDIDSKEVIPQMIIEKPERVSEIVEVTYAKDKGIEGGQEISEVPKRVVSKENKVPEIIDFKDENIPEIIDSKEKTIPEIIDSREKTIPEIIDSREKTIPEIIDSKEKTIPEIIDSREKTIPEIIDSREKTIPEIIDSKEITIPEIIDSREKTIPEIIDSREKTIPEIIDSKEKTIPEIIDSRGKTIPEIIDSKEKTIPEIIDSKEKTIPEIIDSKEKTVPEISDKKAQEIVGPTEVEDLKTFKKPVVKYVKKADKGSLLDLKRTAPTFEKFEVNTQIKIKLAGTETMTPKNIIIKLVNKADIQFDEDKAEELDDVEQRRVPECKVNQEPVTVIVDTEKEKEITQVNYTKEEFIDKESQTVLKSLKELMLFKDADTQAHLSAETTPSVKETTKSYVNSIQSILSDKISQDERMDCFAIDIFPWPDILLGPSSNINSISYTSDTPTKKYSSNISPTKTLPSSDLSLVTKKSFLAKILQGDVHDMSQEASQEIVSRKSLLDTTFDFKSAIISHSNINMETAGSQSSAMECKVLCWDEHPEKTTQSTLERVNTCDILCWRSEQYYHKTSSFSSAKQETETPAPLYDPVKYFNKLLPGQTNQSQQGFFPEKIARFEHSPQKIALDSETKLPEILSDMPKPMQENFDFPIPQYQVYKTKGKDPTRPLTYINKVSNDRSIQNSMASPRMMFEKQSTSIRNHPARDLLPPIPRMQQHVFPYSSFGAGVVSTASAPPSPVAQPPTPSHHMVSSYNTPMAMLASTHSHEQEVNSISEKKNAMQKKLEQLEERAAIKSREMMELKQMMLQLQQQQGWQLPNIPPPTTSKVNPSLEGMKAALDNILVKCRTKDQMITAMADELQRQRRSSAMERVLTDVAIDKANMVPDFDRARLHEYLQHPRPRTVPECAQHETPGFPKGLTVLRRINPNTLLLGWDPPAPTITGIIGYDVYVNGNIQERVRSATRNRTLLHGLDLTRKIEILVYAVTPKGKFADPAFVSYQDTVDRPSRPMGHI